MVLPLPLSPLRLSSLRRTSAGCLRRIALGVPLLIAVAGPGLAAAQSPSQSPSPYTVRPGQSLTSIAAELAPGSGRSPEALAAQLLRDNPRAFIAGDPDRLMAGVALRLPQQEQPAEERAPVASSAPSLSSGASLGEPASGAAVVPPVTSATGMAAPAGEGAASSAGLPATATVTASSAPTRAAAVNVASGPQEKRGRSWFSEGVRIGLLVLLILVLIIVRLVLRRRREAAAELARPKDDSGRLAGQRERETLAASRDVAVSSTRAEEALHAQLLRAPRDVGALLGLLEIYAQRGDTAHFEAHAHLLWDETDGDGALWQRAAQLGRGLEPGNPLYDSDPRTALAAHARAAPPAPPLPGRDQLDLSLPAPGSEAFETPAGEPAGESASRPASLGSFNDPGEEGGNVARAPAPSTPAAVADADSPGATPVVADGPEGLAGAVVIGASGPASEEESIAARLRGIDLNLDDGPEAPEPEPSAGEGGAPGAAAQPASGERSKNRVPPRGGTRRRRR